MGVRLVMKSLGTADHQGEILPAVADGLPAGLAIIFPTQEAAETGDAVEELSDRFDFLLRLTPRYALHLDQPHRLYQRHADQRLELLGIRQAALCTAPPLTGPHM